MGTRAGSSSASTGAGTGEAEGRVWAPSAGAIRALSANIPPKYKEKTSLLISVYPPIALFLFPVALAHIDRELALQPHASPAIVAVAQIEINWAAAQVGEADGQASEMRDVAHDVARLLQ